MHTFVDGGGGGGVNHELSDNALSWHIVLWLAYRCKVIRNYQIWHHQGTITLHYIVDCWHVAGEIML